MSSPMFTISFTVPKSTVLTDFVEGVRQLDWEWSAIASGFRSGFGNISYYKNALENPYDTFTAWMVTAGKIYTTFQKAKRWLPTYDIHTLANHPKKIFASLVALSLFSTADSSQSVPKLLLITNVALTILEFRAKPVKAVISLTTMAISWIDYKGYLPKPISYLWNRVIPWPMMALDFYYDDSLFTRMKIVGSAISLATKM